MVSQGTKDRWAHYNPNTGAWDEFIATGSTVPLMESGAAANNVKPRALLGGPQDKRIGVVMPLFPQPFDDSAFTQAAVAIKRHPAQDVFVVVDSDTTRLSGVAADKKLVNWIRFLKANGAKVLGNMSTNYGLRDTTLNKAIVDTWKKHYPDIDGIFLSHMGQGEHLAPNYYKPLVEHIRNDAGYQYVVGSIGTAQELINTTPENVESLVRDAGLDIIILYEGKNFPEPSNFAQGWMQKYPRSKMGIIITGVNADEGNVQKMQDFIMQLVGTYKAAGYVYVNSDSGARTNNPYMALSSLFEAQLQTMDMLAGAEGNVVSSNSRRRSSSTRSMSSSSREDITEQDVTAGDKPILENIVEEDVSQAPPPVRDLEKDVNGIKKIYPDATENFQEWHFNEREPTKDPRFKDWENANLKRMQDGSNAWYLDGGTKGQVRIAGWSEPGTYWEDATELTIYFKWLHDSKLPSGKSVGKYWQVYLRGGDHSNQKGRGGEASCYKARITATGQVYLVKEIQHDPPGYTKNVSGKKISFPTPKGSIKGQWVGMKLVLYNIQEEDNGPVWVKIECWIDSTCTTKEGNLDTSQQKWVKAAEYIDKGTWRCSDMKKPTPWPSVDYNSKTPNVRQPTEIISKPGGTEDGNLGAYRTDFRASAIKFFSIRQIQNPSHAD